MHDIVAPAGEEQDLPQPRRLAGHAGQRPAELGSTIHLGLFALMLAVSMPRLLRSFSPSWDPLDTSWAWMMGYALQHHLQWGKSVVFTYGPLGFLSHSYFYSAHALWAISATAHLISWFAFGLGFACVLRRLSPDDKPPARTPALVAIGWVVGAGFLHLSDQCAVLGVLLLVLALAEEGSAAVTVELALCGALLALGALIKATGLLVSLFALVVYPALWWYAGRRKNTVYLSLIPLLSFFVSFCALWSLASQSFAHLPDYVRGTWAIVTGYTPAMSITGLGIQIRSALLILSLFTAVLVGLHVGGRKLRVTQWLLLGGVAFWAWKEGFTLQDWGYFRHPMMFFGTALLIATVGTALLAKESSRYLKACVYGAYVVALLCSFHGYPLERLSYTEVPENYINYLALISSASRRAAEERGQIAAIQHQFQLPEGVLRALGHSSVNVLPWSLMMAQGYGMRLDTSPVIQSYSAYTPYLDRMNARQIWTGGGADKVIYTYGAIANRYPPFDEPATFQAILTCYRTAQAGYYAVLRRVTCAPPEMPVEGKPEEGSFGQWIAVPADASYAAIGVRTTLIGHAAEILYKPVYVRLLFKLADGSVKGPYRFIYPVAEDGLFVRYFIGSQSETTLLFSGNASGLRKITDIKLVTDRPSLDYAKHFEVRFFDANP